MYACMRVFRCLWGIVCPCVFEQSENAFIYVKVQQLLLFINKKHSPVCLRYFVYWRRATNALVCKKQMDSSGLMLWWDHRTAEQNTEQQKYQVSLYTSRPSPQINSLFLAFPRMPNHHGYSLMQQAIKVPKPCIPLILCVLLVPGTTTVQGEPLTHRRKQRCCSRCCCCGNEDRLWGCKWRWRWKWSR